MALHLSVILSSLALISTLAVEQPFSYATLASGTCESNGYQSIYGGSECKKAAKSMKYTWGAEFLNVGNYPDLADGCSIRGGWTNLVGGFDLFTNPKGSCIIGHDAPDWIPELKGIASCKCTRFSPCICKRLVKRA